MSNTIRLASLSSHSSVDGPGLRTVVWFQGCPHHCVGCHNPQTQTIEDGYCVEIDELIIRIEAFDNKKITLSGGEPFLQSLALLDLVERLNELGYDIWCYTGYTLEECLSNPIFKCVLQNIDFLVDGPFIMDQKDHTLIFRGSKNQNVINLKAYFETHTMNDQKSWVFVD